MLRCVTCSEWGHIRHWTPTTMLALLPGVVLLLAAACAGSPPVLLPSSVSPGKATYEFNVSVATMAPDCFEKPGILVNGLFQPTLEFTHGDTVTVGGCVCVSKCLNASANARMSLPVSVCVCTCACLSVCLCLPVCCVPVCLQLSPPWVGLAKEVAWCNTHRGHLDSTSQRSTAHVHMCGGRLSWQTSMLPTHMMGHTWATHGSHMGHTWVTHGSHMGHTWATHGSHMGHT